MKHVSFLFASMLLLWSQSVLAQPQVAEPEPEVSDEEAIEAEIEEELESETEPGEHGADGPDQDPLPEDPTPEPGPNIVHEVEGGGGLGATVSTPASEGVMPDQVVEQVAEEEHAEEVREDVAEDIASGDAEEGGTSTADRLAQANPNSGLPWALPINFTQNLSVWTLSRSAGQTYNPTYSWSFSIIPRWNFESGISVGVRQNLDIEWTDSDITTNNRQLWWGDTQLDVTYTLPWKPLGTLIIPSFLLSAPTSFISRAAERYIGPGGRLLLIKPVGILGGLILGGGASYTYWAGARNGLNRSESDFPCERAGAPGVRGQSDPNCGVVDSNTPVRHVLSAGVFATLIPAAHWQINLSYTAIYNKGDSTGVDCIFIDSGEVCVDDNSANRHWRTISSFGFSVGYDVTSYMTLSLGYSTLAFYPDSEGGLENPFYNENTQISLGLQFRVDGLVVELKADDEEEATGEETARQEGLRRLAF